MLFAKQKLYFEKTGIPQEMASGTVNNIDLKHFKRDLRNFASSTN